MHPADPGTSTVDLTGLPPSSPIGFMAAIGLLRVCSQDHGQDVQLSWTPQHARLHGLSRPALFDLLAEHMRGRSSAPEFNFEVTDDKGRRGPVMHMRAIPPADFRAAALSFAGDARALGFLAGFGTDAVVGDKGFVARNRLDFSSARQSLFQEFRALSALLDPSAKKPRLPWNLRVERALLGGPYEEQHTFGWDPACQMNHAHQPKAPTNSATPGQPMMVWLAVEALPLHPVFPAGARRARTTGFAGGSAYVWPQWAMPLTLAEVTLLRQRPVDTLDRLPGTTAVWTSAVTSVGKFGFLLPAARTRSVGMRQGRFAQAEDADESMA